MHDDDRWAKQKNLNELGVAWHRYEEKLVVPLREHYAGIQYRAHATVFFRDLKTRLIEQINRADYVFGCVAWLTDHDILTALGKKRGVQLLVQKEDFLRPDSDAVPGPEYYLGS